mmetsp:Transcript_12438/g.40117  ORF Transcript_12438/g.40117 Transcript_12438/m.40117 type:complete len:239 (+) Transcript_12438:275-991(+)
MRIGTPISSLKKACVGILHALTQIDAHADSSRKRQRWTRTCAPAPPHRFDGAFARSSGARPSSEQGPISHCAAHEVTHALSRPEKAGKGRAKRTSNQKRSPFLPVARTSPHTLAGSSRRAATGGQSGKHSLSTRREASATSGPLSATRARARSTMPRKVGSAASRPSSAARRWRKMRSKSRSGARPRGPEETPSIQMRDGSAPGGGQARTTRTGAAGTGSGRGVGTPSAKASGRRVGM